MSGRDPRDRRATRYEFGRRAFILALLLWMLSTSAFQVYQTAQNSAAIKATRENAQAIRDTQTEGSPFIIALTKISEDVLSAQESSAQTLAQIRDCIERGGVCNRDQRRATAAILQSFLVGSGCASGFTDLDDDARVQATLDCVAAWTAEHTR